MSTRPKAMTMAAATPAASLNSPSGVEGYFRDIGRRAPHDPPRSRTPEEREALDARFGIRYRR